MRQIHPEDVKNVDVEEFYRAAPRGAPAGRPWVIVNMIQSVDGAATADGLSGGLGGSGDKRVFFALRGLADVIIVAAGTARAEGYGPVKLPDDVQAARVSRGQEARPRVAIVSGSLRLDWESPLFAESSPRPIVITTEDADPEALARARGSADVIACGEGRADLAASLAELGARGHGLALSEGGPSLNGAMLATDLVDELALSVAPVLCGGDGIRIMRGAAPEVPRSLTLAHVLEEQNYLFLRYVRA